MAGPGRATSGRPTLQTSSNQHNSNRLARTSVTNVVNLSQKTTIFSEKADGLTTFVTTGQKSTRKTPWIDDVCNNTHRATRQHTMHHRCGGRRRDLPRCRWAAAGPGRASTQRTEPHVSTPSAAGVEGAGGTGGHGRASRSTTPSRRLACGDLAGGRARRRPEHQRSHKQQHTARTSRGRAAAHRHTQRPGPPAPGTPVGPQAARPASTTQRNEAATGFPATASSRSRSAVHNSATSNQAVMST